MATLAELFADEQQQISGGATACGYTCVCHGGHVCQRTGLHTDSPHIALLPDSSLVQWGPGGCQTPEEITAGQQAAAAEQAAATNALVQQLRDAGALPPA